MDFEQLLSEVKGLRSVFEGAKKEQADKLIELQTALQERGKQLDDQFVSLESHQAAEIRQQTAEQSVKISELQQSQATFAQHQGEAITALQQTQANFAQQQGEKVESIGRDQQELKTAIEAARQETQKITVLIAENGSAVSGLRKETEEGMRYLHDQAKTNLEKFTSEIDKLKADVAKQDQSKLVDELQNKFTAFRGETISSVTNLSGQLEKNKTQLEPVYAAVKGFDAKLRKTNDDVADTGTEVAKVSKKTKLLEEKVRWLEENGTGGGSVNPTSKLSTYIAIALGAIAVIGLVAGGLWFKQQMDTSKTQLDALNTQVKYLTKIVEATPTPSPTPSPTPTPSATPEPTPTPTPVPSDTPEASAEVTPNP